MNTDTDYATTGTYWGNVCGTEENFMPSPIRPDPHCYPGVWSLVSTNVTITGTHQGSPGARTSCSLFLTWTWKRV